MDRWQIFGLWIYPYAYLDEGFCKCMNDNQRRILEFGLLDLWVLINSEDLPYCYCLLWRDIYCYRELCSVFSLLTCWPQQPPLLIGAAVSVLVWYLWSIKHTDSAMNTKKKKKNEEHFPKKNKYLPTMSLVACKKNL